MATGITKRHHRRCPSRDGGTCGAPCVPVFEAWVWDKREGKKIAKRFTSLTEAKNWRGDAAPAIRKGTMASPSRVTLREFADGWLEKAERDEIPARHKRPYKPSVLRGYRSDLEKYVYPELGAARLTEVHRRDLQALVDELTPKLSGQKVRNIVVAVSAVYRYALRRDLVAANPARDIDLPAPGERREWSASPQDARALIDALPEGERALWATATYSGLRRGELRALRVSDLHGLTDEVGERWISVERGWDDKAGPIAPKSKAGTRRALMPAILREILAAHVDRTGRSGDDLVFGRGARDPFPTRCSDRADAAWKKAGLERVTIHQCRHGFGSFLIAAGVSESRADRYMGHSSGSIGDRYRHQLPGDLSTDAATLNEYLTRTPADVVQMPTGAHTGAQAPAAASLSETA